MCLTKSSVRCYLAKKLLKSSRLVMKDPPGAITVPTSQLGILLFNSRLKIFSGKLKSRWSGPFTITEVYPYGTTKLSHANGSNFKVNFHHLKHYYGGDTPPLVIPDLQTFPKDNNSGIESSLRLRYGCIKDHKKTVKNGQARTRESEEYKKKPKNQSRSQKSQASVKSSQRKVNSWSTEVNHYKTKPHNNPIPVLQLSQKAQKPMT
ncbi:hypothetical protein Tco_0798142 [Tanacetum coccineum]